MADQVPSQADFVGMLGLGLMIVAIATAVFLVAIPLFAG
jgi:hypothetical protein